MKPNPPTRTAAAITLAKGKMYEFDVPDDQHIAIPSKLDLKLQFPLALGTIGDFAAEQVRLVLARREVRTPVEEVLFAAQVLVATVDAKVTVNLSGLVRLIAAVAFFLADSPGRAAAHCKGIRPSELPEDDGLALGLLAMLSAPWALSRLNDGIPAAARQLSETMRLHYEGKADFAAVTTSISGLRSWAYESGNAHELMMSDLLCAISIKRAGISAWTTLPAYTGQPIDSWTSYLSRRDSIKDLWPAQQMLGVHGIYAGKSAVVQMPTSAGKTRATELILRAAFRSGRTTLAVIVAPFRALCYEIAEDLRSKFRPDGYQINQLSDALQQDYRLDLSAFLELGIESAPHVVVLTPEKLLYIIRQEPSFVEHVGLVIYDEGHQFDSSARGVAYELLLTTIKRALAKTAQTVLISAVISNADELAKWLLRDEPTVVNDPSVQTSRHVAFTTMSHGSTGQLQFESIIEGEQEYFVPRLISHQSLDGKGQPKVFPTDESGSIALYLGLRLMHQGGVAIYVKAPASATKIIRDAANNTMRRLPGLKTPSMVANPKELAAMVKLYGENFGTDSYLTKGAALGLFAHTGETPQGIRLAIEHAMRESLISLIVCTSTLAQGVNLPIRYLLVTSQYQSAKVIKTRDFQNLIGRAGRAGMYGEGTIIFTNPSLYDNRKSKKREWQEVKGLLNAANSAPTQSTLLRLIRPIFNRYESKYLATYSPAQVLDALLIDSSATLSAILEVVATLPSRDGFASADVIEQISEKIRTISSIETFLMSHQEIFDTAEENAVKNLARETFAYHLATEEQKLLIEEAFQKIFERIKSRQIPNETQARYGRALLGLTASLEIDAWVRENLFTLQLSESALDILTAIWDFVDAHAETAKLHRLEPAPARRALVTAWVAGTSFNGILDELKKNGGYIKHGSQKRDITLETIVGLCQDGISFKACLVVSAMSGAFSEFSGDSSETLAGYFDYLNKMLKYGLPTAESIAVYEAGFADRVLAQKIAHELPEGIQGQDQTRLQLRVNSAAVEAILSEYPEYFSEVLKGASR